MYGFLKGGAAMDATEAEVIYDDAIAQYRPSVPAEYTIIPDLYGYGTDTRAAYGLYDSTGDPADLPEILHVDSLSSGTGNTDSTHGTFAWCVTQTYPRIIVFDTSGTIDGGSARVIVASPYCSIYGQTAADNVAFAGCLEVRASEVVIQHLPVRGNNISDLDGLNVNSNNNAVSNVIIDHCSVTGNRDEQLSVSETTYTLSDITVANCIIGNGHESAHQYGSLNYGTRIFHMGNLYIHTLMRSPQLAYGALEMSVCNTLAYNWQHSVVNIGSYISDVHEITYIGNESIEGSSMFQQDSATNLIYNKGLPPKASTRLYMEDNINRGTTISGFGAINDNGNGYTVGDKDLPTNFTPIAASATKAYVLASVGARPGGRDNYDDVLIDDVINLTGLVKTSRVSLPTLTVDTTDFTPVANPHTIASGETVYTNLEKQLHALATAVE